jgi:exosortase/archaeosortase family protein
MLVTFFALATAVAFVIRRPLWEKVVVVLSAAPVAVAANVVRITATGVLHRTAGSRVANAVFHDLAGWLMMPLALGLLWAELEFLACLFVRPEPIGSAPLAVLRPTPRLPRVDGYPVRVNAPTGPKFARP